MKIAYVGPFVFPSSNANSLRVKGMVEALVLLDHEVHICSNFSEQQGGASSELPKGIHLHHVQEYTSGLFSELHQGLRGLFLGDITLRWLQSFQRKPDLIVLYGTHLGYLLRLLRFCRKYNIPLLLDVVEWYDPRHLPGGIFGPFALTNELSMRFVAKNAAGVFVISRYLQEHFSRQGCRTLRVPPLFSFAYRRPQQFREFNGKLNLCYVGSPGRKEDMESIFIGLQMAYEDGTPFLMHVVGLTFDQFQDSYGMRTLSLFETNSFIKFYGWLENTEARNIIASCDFLVLLRKNQRFVKAGFPSKVAESLCLGTPILANLSSNLDEYLIDGQNSIIVREAKAEDFCTAVCKASLLGKSDLSEMQNHAARCADSNFRIENHVKKISNFIET